MSMKLTREQINKIIDECQKQIVKNPHNKEAHHDLAVARMEIGQFDLALEGFCYAELNQPDEAVEMWKKTLILNKRHDNAMYFIGKIYGMKGMWDMAIHQFNQALKVNDEIPQYYQALAEMYLAKGEFQTAVEHWQKILTLDEKNVQAHVNLCACYLDMHDLEKSVLHGGIAVSLGVVSPTLYYDLAMAYLFAGIYDESIKYFLLAKEGDEKDIPTRLSLGEAYIANGERQKAIAEWKELLEKDAASVEAWYNLGLAAAQDKNPEQA